MPHFGDFLNEAFGVAQGLWPAGDARRALKSTSGRKRLNIHGCLDLETFAFQFIEAEKINAETTRQLLEKVELAHASMRVIHVFLDNARYHHAKVLKPWLEAPKRRVKLHFLPAYAPHLNPIEPLWGVMHKHVTHNRYYANFDDFTEAILTFFRQTLPKNWRNFRDTITDNFRVISHDDYQTIQWWGYIREYFSRTGNSAGRTGNRSIVRQIRIFGVLGLMWNVVLVTLCRNAKTD